jgi:hypothetical protein
VYPTPLLEAELGIQPVENKSWSKNWEMSEPDGGNQEAPSSMASKSPGITKNTKEREGLFEVMAGCKCRITRSVMLRSRARINTGISEAEANCY